jgi:predicted GNAT superfamily acetyltransferase
MDVLPEIGAEAEELPMLVIEIPANFSNLRTADAGLALAWREHSRDWFETCFSRGYLVTDFIYLPGLFPRSFYVLTHGESTL